MVAITFHRIGQLVQLATILVSLIPAHTAKGLNRVRRKVQDAGSSNRVQRREILLTANGENGCSDWSGKSESTCNTFTSIEDLSSSGCTSREYAQVIQTGLNGSSISSAGVWCPCGDQICSMIFRVGNSTKVAQVAVSAWVDRKAEILVFAEFSVEKGEFFQIGKLHAKTESKEGLQRVQFDYSKEEYLDMSEINVTMVRNGGLALMDTFVIALEESKQTTTTPAPPPSDNVLLDVRKDMTGNEWIQVDCHYSDYYEDFWTFGCPVNADSNYLPPSMGFWYPCRDKTCSFIYDGTKDKEPREVIIDGYFQGGEIVLYGKQSLLEETHWKLLTRKSFHNSTEKVLRLDLTSSCNVKVLLIAVNADEDNVILVDKVEVKVQPHDTPKDCQLLSHYEKSTEINSAPSVNLLPEFMFLAIIVFYILAC